MANFKLVSNYKPSGDQKNSIPEITNLLEARQQHIVLRGATGTGKTFTIANIIAKHKKPTLIMVHNKTLAGQLYMEFKELFPHNAVEYFVSYFDFYQPEAYLPRQDLFIDKSSKRNDEIEMLRRSTTNSLIERDDVIVIASVAAIYGLQDPEEYKSQIIRIKVNQKITNLEFYRLLVEKGYKRNNFDLLQGCFRPKGDIVEIVPSWADDFNIKISFFGDVIEEIFLVDPTTGKKIRSLNDITIFPGEGYVTGQEKNRTAIESIKEELSERIKFFDKNNQLIESQRIEQRVRHDLESLQEFGTCGGIENYSRHFDQRPAGSRPFTIFDYLPKDFLLVIDESHISLPQIRGMHAADISRKTTLVNYGFRLPSAIDNRPLKFDEFLGNVSQAIYVSATPSDFEIALSGNKLVEQIIRPTGLIDPEIVVHKTANQLDRVAEYISNAIAKKTRVFITTLTIKMSEELTSFLQLKGYKVAYLHSKLKTLERMDILLSLRKGIVDTVIGVNLLREGLDVPEVSTVIILDADKEGFLRNTTSLIQTIGRAARNINGLVVMFADKETPSMKAAIQETYRRRKIQIEYNQKNHITPVTVSKKLSEMIKDQNNDASLDKSLLKQLQKKTSTEKLILDLKRQMHQAAKDMNFEKAASIRDIIIELQIPK